MTFPAALLADGLRERGAEVTVADGLTAMGPVVRAILRSGAETVLRRLPWLFEIQYWLVSRCGPPAGLGEFIGTRLGFPACSGSSAGNGPTSWCRPIRARPSSSAACARHGSVTVPCVGAITDLAALRFWANPGIDLHLIIHEESREEVAAITGRSDGS